MSFFSDLFKKKPKEPPPPRTREDMESSLEIREKVNHPIKTSSGILQHSYQRKRLPEEEEQKLLKETFDLIASVPAGKKLLDEVAQGGYNVYFEAFCSSNLGCMYGNSKKIMLSPPSHGSVAELATTAFHEMTHALQQERTGYLGNKSSDLTLADQFKFHRAAEAAACTEEANFAYQIKEQHPEVERKLNDFPMYRAFAAEMEKSGDKGKAGEAAFKAWYGYKHYQDSYESNHVNNFSYFMKQCYASRKKEYLVDTISSEEVLSKVFISEDLRSNISPDFLTSKEAFSVSDYAINKLNEKSAMYFNGLKDASLGNMYSYETGEQRAPQQQPSKEPMAASLRPQKSMMASLKQIDKTEKTKQVVAAKAKNKQTQL